ncbi:MAG: hypothetical protein ACRC77_01935 [Bacteroidales bacterium]
MEENLNADNQSKRNNIPLIDDQSQPVISIGDWFITIILLAIPLVNFIMLLVWAFGGGTNPNKANFAKATLIVYLIMLVLSVLFASTIMGFFMNNMYNF